MPHPFEAQLAHIRETLLRMSSLTEQMLADALRALVTGDAALADAVEAADSAIDELEVTIDELVISYIATHAPVATDCRLMLVASKISTNLERIGDQATTVARRARKLSSEPAANGMTATQSVLDSLTSMATQAQALLRDSITAFIEANHQLARELLGRDKAIDALNREIVRTLSEEMARQPEWIASGLHLITISKALERVADHAENIAEEVFYLYRGKDIRHQHPQAGGAAN